MYSSPDFDEVFTLDWNSQRLSPSAACRVNVISAFSGLYYAPLANSTMLKLHRTHIYFFVLYSAFRSEKCYANPKTETSSPSCSLINQCDKPQLLGPTVTMKKAQELIRYFIFPPHLTSASALPGQTGNPEIASFHLNVACFFHQKNTKHS